MYTQVFEAVHWLRKATHRVAVKALHFSSSRGAKLIAKPPKPWIPELRNRRGGALSADKDKHLAP